MLQLSSETKAHVTLFPRFMLTRQQVVYGLERVELARTSLFRDCPFTPRTRIRRQHNKKIACDRTYPYRMADGSCNNLARPEWGVSFAPFLRFLPHVYGDTIGEEFRYGSAQHIHDNFGILVQQYF